MNLARGFSVVAFVVLAFSQCTSGIVIGEVLDIIKVAKDVAIAVAKAWSLIDEHTDFSEVPLPLVDKTERRLFNKMGRINDKLEELSSVVDAVGSQTISTVLHTLPERVRLELRLNDLLDYITRMDVTYRHMSQYLTYQDEIERLTLEDYAKSIVSHDAGSVRNLVERIHAFIVPNGDGFTNTGLLKLLGKSLKLMPEDINYGLSALENVWAWARSQPELRGVYALYEGFRRFQSQQTAKGRIPSPKQAWIDFTEAVLNDPRNAVNDSLARLHELISRENLFKEALKEVEGDMLCSSQQSPQQVLFNLYNAIALTELKGYSMIQFSYMLLKLYDQGNFTKEAQIMKDRYEQRTNNAIESVKTAMQSASTELWNCDPKKHVLGETYVEITQLLQGYMQNEVDLNPEGTCRESCSEYTYTKSHGCYQNLYCRQQRRCNGKIVNCQFIDSDMWVCPSDPQTGRRYEYIEYENGRVLGRKQGCSRGTTKVDSWWRWLFWHCSYCMCLCDEQGQNSDRYVNLRATIADIQNNMVVTGLRFVKNNRIIHLQIQEGRLLPRGTIDKNSVHWVPVDNYKILDKNVHNEQDFHTLSWENRAVDLDDLVSDEGHLVTGVRFKKIGSHLNFEIYITPFDFESGKLLDPLSRSIWKDNPNTDSSLKSPRKKLNLVTPDVPTRSPSPSVPDSNSDQYIEFTHTDFDRDAAQTTVPFIDAQPVESLLPVPLSGAGIFHKGRKHFGGFIAPKIITYDYSKHLQPAFDTEPESN